MPEQDLKPLEFKIESDDVYFKEGNMPYFTHYGRLYTAVSTSEENRFEIKKFDLSLQDYVHTNDLTSFTIYGQTVEVVDGFATAIPPEPEPEPDPQPSNTDILAKLTEQEENNLNRDEMMLEQQLMLLNIDLNTSI